MKRERGKSLKNISKKHFSTTGSASVNLILRGKYM
jgi:hypothetical protein